MNNVTSLRLPTGSRAREITSFQLSLTSKEIRTKDRVKKRWTTVTTNKKEKDTSPEGLNRQAAEARISYSYLYIGVSGKGQVGQESIALRSLKHSSREDASEERRFHHSCKIL
jgi:hypothetical protein